MLCVFYVRYYFYGDMIFVLSLGRIAMVTVSMLMLYFRLLWDKVSQILLCGYWEKAHRMETGCAWRISTLSQPGYQFWKRYPCQLLCSVVPSNVIKVLVFVCKPCYELVILSPCSNCIQTSSELKPMFHFILGFTIFF